MTEPKYSEVSVTSAYNKATKPPRAWAAWPLKAVLALCITIAGAAILFWTGRTAWRESRRTAALQLQTALESQAHTLARWYRERQSTLERFRDQLAIRPELKMVRESAPAAMEFDGYAVVDREGKIVFSTEDGANALVHGASLKDTLQTALAGGFTATPRMATADAKSQSGANASIIAFAAPIWFTKPSEPRSELALPNAVILAWVRASTGFDSLFAAAKFGETGRVQLAEPNFPLHPNESILILDPTRQHNAQPEVIASKWLAEYKTTLVARMSAQEAYASYKAILPPLVVAGCLLALGSLFSLFRILFPVWAARNKAACTAPGKQIGCYRIEEQIGEGGMGVVYRATHLLMRRPAAIKLLDKNRSDANCIARFEREVRLTSLLSHPNTITVYDYGLTDEGAFYYAMEFVDGVSLDALVANGPLSEGRVIHLLAQLCGSLSEAHQVGLIHRDIKPANVLVTERGGLCDFVKLLDFGLVKRVQKNSIAITSDGAAVGTPLFMSPEAIESPDDIDARSDLYSVGAIGYYLLTTKHVFSGKTSTEVCLKHLQERPTPPSMRGPNTISPDLEHLILQCLEKDRDNRPPTAFDLQQSLLACREAFTWTEDEAALWWAERKHIDRIEKFAQAMC
jgi:hypothetical protein